MTMPDGGATATRDFLVPDLGEGLEDATIVRWLVEVGEEVALDQPLCVVETAKAEVEVPSPYAGTLVERGGEEGETLRVGAVLARFAARAPERTPTMVGYGTDTSGDRSRRPAAAPAAPAGDGGAGSGGAGGAGRPLAKPPVRKLARDLGVDLAALAPGSGPGGIVTREDVERAAAAPPTERRVPVTGVRSRVAEKVAAARRQIPDATCHVTADCSRLVEARRAIDEELDRRGAERVVTPFSLICALAVRALRDSPLLNASYVEDGPEIVLHEHVHLGVATATERGLVVVVVRHAEARDVLDLAGELRRLATAARDGTVAPADLQGSTFTVSNFGAFDLDDGVPVINHPEAAILGVGAIKPRPVVVDDQVVARSTVALTLAFDHRVCDGAEAGRFLADLRRLVEQPALALLG